MATTTTERTAERAAEQGGEMMDKIKGTAQRPAAAFPTDAFMWAAGASVVGSLSLKLSGRHQDALFVGQWAPTFLLLGVLGKLAKHFGND
jgi:hypothetical protein